MADALVSIIIPAYNAEKYIGQAIESALQQTWANKEIIVVDDGSIDQSLAIAQTYKGDGVQVIHQYNQGASAARNAGLKQAKGQYIQFLDADDVLSADKIQLQVEALNNAPDKVAVCSTVHFRVSNLQPESEPSVYEEQFLVNSDDPAWFLTNLWGGYGDNGSMIQPNAWLTPRTVIDKAGFWNEHLTVDDDGEFFCRVLLHSLGVIKTSGYNYYRHYDHHSRSLSSGKMERHYTSLYTALNLKYRHVACSSPTRALKNAYARSLQEVSNSMYPYFPTLRKEVERKLKELNVVITNKQSLKERLKKRITSVIGTHLIRNWKAKFMNKSNE